jgi:hypothetical protein
VAGKCGLLFPASYLTRLPASSPSPPASFLQFTVNPKSGSVDYCLPTSPDFVSVEAVHSGLVRRDAGGQEIMGAVPAYITADHFERC